MPVMAPIVSIMISVGWGLRPGTKDWWNSSVIEYIAQAKMSKMIGRKQGEKPDERLLNDFDG